MVKIICDKCGRDITKAADKRYMVAISKEKPNEKGELPPSDWLLIKEVCMGCALEIEQSFKH